MPDPLLVTLLIKVGVAAAIASFLIRFRFFSRALMTEERTYRQRLLLALSFALVFGASVGVRIVTKSYQAADLGLEGSFLAGLIGGYLVALVAGVLISIPALINGEFFTVILFAGCAVAAALLRDIASDPEDVWQISPFFDRSLFRLYLVERDYPRAGFHLLALSVIFAVEFSRQIIAQLFEPRYLFVLRPAGQPIDKWLLFGTYLATLFAITIPLKIWNNQRNESKLKEQNTLLMEAKLEALSRQINPHFLFNTLNSVSSLIRINPDQARKVVYRLSHILRRLLRQQEHFVPLREEMSFIDDYLAIEGVRFGEKLRFEKRIEEGALDWPVPSMLLQPLIENCIKHGIGNKIEGGSILIEAAVRAGALALTVSDDGVGIREEDRPRIFEKGIGLSNTNQRLQVLYAGRFRFSVSSEPSRGARFRLELPALPGSIAAESYSPRAARDGEGDMGRSTSRLR
ncbi:MAG: histidine kinase [Bryobacterales bacterium]|nr:histidine kinase [Bryobacterales bacterium]